MRNSWLVGTTFTAACVLSFSAIAEEDLFKYNYIDANYLKATEDVPGSAQKKNVGALGVTGSYAAHEVLAIQASYSKLKASHLDVTENINLMALGIDLHTKVAETTEVGFGLARNHSNITGTTAGVPDPSTTNNTNTVLVRVRTAIVPAFRLLASVKKTTGGRFANVNDYGIGAEYEIGEEFSVGLEYGAGRSDAGNSSGITLGGRYYF